MPRNLPLKVQRLGKCSLPSSFFYSHCLGVVNKLVTTRSCTFIRTNASYVGLNCRGNPTEQLSTQTYPRQQTQIIYELLITDIKKKINSIMHMSKQWGYDKSKCLDQRIDWKKLPLLLSALDIETSCSYQAVHKQMLSTTGIIKHR